MTADLRGGSPNVTPAGMVSTRSETARGASTTDTMLAGAWKTARMVLKVSECAGTKTNQGTRCHPSPSYGEADCDVLPSSDGDYILMTIARP